MSTLLVRSLDANTHHRIVQGAAARGLTAAELLRRLVDLWGRCQDHKSKAIHMELADLDLEAVTR